MMNVSEYSYVASFKFCIVNGMLVEYDTEVETLNIGSDFDKLREINRNVKAKEIISANPFLITASGKNSLFLFDLRHVPASVKEFESNLNNNIDTTFIGVEGYLYTVSYENSGQLWRLEDGNLRLYWTKYSDDISGYVRSPKFFTMNQIEDVFILFSRGEMLTIWSCRFGKIISKLKFQAIYGYGQIISTNEDSVAFCNYFFDGSSIWFF